MVWEDVTLETVDMCPQIQDLGGVSHLRFWTGPQVQGLGGVVTLENVHITRVKRSGGVDST